MLAVVGAADGGRGDAAGRGHGEGVRQAVGGVGDGHAVAVERVRGRDGARGGTADHEGGEVQANLHEWRTGFCYENLGKVKCISVVCEGNPFQVNSASGTGIFT